MKLNLNTRLNFNFATTTSNPNQLAAITILVISITAFLASTIFAINTFIRLNQSPASLSTQQAINQRTIQQAVSLLEENTVYFAPKE